MPVVLWTTEENSEAFLHPSNPLLLVRILSQASSLHQRRLHIPVCIREVRLETAADNMAPSVCSHRCHFHHHDSLSQPRLPLFDERAQSCPREHLGHSRLPRYSLIIGFLFAFFASSGALLFIGTTTS